MLIKNLSNCTNAGRKENNMTNIFGSIGQWVKDNLGGKPEFTSSTKKNKKEKKKRRKPIGFNHTTAMRKNNMKISMKEGYEKLSTGDPYPYTKLDIEVDVTRLDDLKKQDRELYDTIKKVLSEKVK
jgi:hypothetical protein